MRTKVKIKQLLDKFVIFCGIRRPGAKHRHDWVASGHYDSDHHDKNRKFQIDFLKLQGLSPDNKLLELGCGTLRGGIPIIAYLNTGNYYGIDVRRGVLSEARKELIENGLEHKNPTIILFKEAEKQIQIKFDVIWSFQVLLHMEQSKLEEALEYSAKHMAPNGFFYATVLVGDYKEDEWQGFPVISRPLEYYKSEAGKFGLDVSELGSLERLGYGKYVPYEKPSSTIMLELKHGN